MRQPYLILAIFAMALSIPNLKAISQVKHLKPGDDMPEVYFADPINGSGGKVPLSSFYLDTKLLLIEFWDVYCASCIGGFPKLEKLQSVFGDSIRILLVTRSTKNQVTKLMERSEIVRNCTLPMVVGDTVLTAYFRYQTVPAYAWVDNQGKLRHFSGAYQYVEEGYIRDFIAGRTFSMPKKDEYGDFAVDESLITEGGGRNLRLTQYYSMITQRVNYDNKAGSFLKEPNNGKRIGVHFINMTIPELFLHAYADSLGYDVGKQRGSNIMLQVTDSARFRFNGSNGIDIQTWLSENTYCYENKLPPHRSEYIFNVMRRDLETHFGVKSRLANRKVKCLVLKPINESRDALERIGATGGSVAVKYPMEGDSVLVRNGTFGMVLTAIKMLISSGDSDITLVDESGIPPNTRVDFEMSGKLGDVAVLNTELARYRLKIVEEGQTVKQLILSD